MKEMYGVYETDGYDYYLRFLSGCESTAWTVASFLKKKHGSGIRYVVETLRVDSTDDSVAFDDETLDYILSSDWD